MKNSIHPMYRPVVFKDASCGAVFMSRSSIKTDRTIVWEDGKEYPLCLVEVSNLSHPFYTGEHRVLDTEGRIEKFLKKYKKA